MQPNLGFSMQSPKSRPWEEQPEEVHRHADETPLLWTPWLFPYGWEKLEPGPSFRNRLRPRSTCANSPEDESRKHLCCGQADGREKAEMGHHAHSAPSSQSHQSGKPHLPKGRERSEAHPLKLSSRKCAGTPPTAAAFLPLLVTGISGVRISALSNIFP